MVVAEHFAGVVGPAGIVVEVLVVETVVGALVEIVVVVLAGIVAVVLAVGIVVVLQIAEDYLVGTAAVVLGVGPVEIGAGPVDTVRDLLLAALCSERVPAVSMVKY